MKGDCWVESQQEPNVSDVNIPELLLLEQMLLCMSEVWMGSALKTEIKQEIHGSQQIIH